MRQVTSKASSASKRANNKLSVIEKRLKENENELRELREKRVKDIADGEKLTAELIANIEARKAMVLVEKSDSQSSLDVKTVALSEQQILELQQVIADIFFLAPAKSWKEYLQTFFTEWVASEELEHSGHHEKSDLVFSYHRMLDIFENLEPFSKSITEAYRVQLAG